MVKVLVWNEFLHEREDEAVKKMYPDGMHTVIAQGLAKDKDIEVKTATLDEPEHGLTVERLAETDVLIWWGHKGHEEVSDEIVKRVRDRVNAGMGLIVLHSGHNSKIFKSLVGATASLKWREMGEKERLWVIAPEHPIVQGIGDYIELPNAEMYGERFDVPTPDELIFISWFEGGEVFRSGCVWKRGLGKMFYFRPGHETYPIFYNDQIMQVLRNAAIWAKPTLIKEQVCDMVEPIEKIEDKTAGFGKAGIIQK